MTAAIHSAQKSPVPYDTDKRISEGVISSRASPAEEPKAATNLPFDVSVLQNEVSKLSQQLAAVMLENGKLQRQILDNAMQWSSSGIKPSVEGENQAVKAGDASSEESEIVQLKAKLAKSEDKLRMHEAAAEDFSKKLSDLQKQLVKSEANAKNDKANSERELLLARARIKQLGFSLMSGDVPFSK